jgi:hypothetical protein
MAVEISRNSILNDAAHWRERADEARALADQMSDPDARASMLRVAQEYEKIAERALARVRESATN